VKATRREALKGALAVPAVAGLPRTSWARHGAAVLLYDASLQADRHLAEAHIGQVVPIEGDRIRFARAVFERRPSLVIGLSRHADALLIEEVAREVGYRPVTAPASLGANGWVLAPSA
jgi:hypothetical protein